MHESIRVREAVGLAVQQLCGPGVDHVAVVDTCVEAISLSRSISIGGHATRRARNIAELLFVMDHPDLTEDLRSRASLACQIAVLRLLPA